MVGLVLDKLELGAKEASNRTAVASFIVSRCRSTLNTLIQLAYRGLKLKIINRGS